MLFQSWPVAVLILSRSGPRCVMMTAVALARPTLMTRPALLTTMFFLTAEPDVDKTFVNNGSSCEIPLGVPNADGGMPVWRGRWSRLLEFSGDRTIIFEMLPELLMEVCSSSLPGHFAEYFSARAGVSIGGEHGDVGWSTAARGQRRQRDILPLPQANLSVEEMPRQNSLSFRDPRRWLNAPCLCASVWQLMLS